jgi:hypothetical protein
MTRQADGFQVVLTYWSITKLPVLYNHLKGKAHVYNYRYCIVSAVPESHCCQEVSGQ